jgi:voltage-gated sodium channel
VKHNCPKHVELCKKAAIAPARRGSPPRRGLSRSHSRLACFDPADEEYSIGRDISEKLQNVERKLWIEAKTLVDSKRAHGLVNVVIILNALQLGLAADVRGPGPEHVWEICEHVFTVFFLVEMVVKQGILRKEYFQSKWNIFDMIVVLASILSVWVMPAVHVSNTTVIAVGRLFRLLRMAKLLRVVPQFRIIFDGMLQAMQSMLWVGLLGLFIIFMVSIICVTFAGRETSGYADYSREIEVAPDGFNNYQYFGTVSRSMVTLLSFFTMAETSDVVRPMLEVQPVLLLFLVSIMCVIFFGLMNILVGMIMDHVMNTVALIRQDEDYKVHVAMAKAAKRLCQLMMEVDENGDGRLKLRELEEQEAQDMHELLRILQLPHAFSLEDLISVFDVDLTGDVTDDEFLSGIVSLIQTTDFQRDFVQRLETSRSRKQVLHLEKRMESMCGSILSAISELRAEIRGELAPPLSMSEKLREPKLTVHPTDALDSWERKSVSGGYFQALEPFQALQQKIKDDAATQSPIIHMAQVKRPQLPLVFVDQEIHNKSSRLRHDSPPLLAPRADVARETDAGATTAARSPRWTAAPRKNPAPFRDGDMGDMGLDDETPFITLRSCHGILTAV